MEGFRFIRGEMLKTIQKTPCAFNRERAGKMVCPGKLCKLGGLCTSMASQVFFADVGWSRWGRHKMTIVYGKGARSDSAQPRSRARGKWLQKSAWPRV